MAALSKCLPVIEGSLGRQLNDDERAAIARQASGLVRRMNRAASSAEAEAMLQDYTDRIRAQAIQAKRTTAMNYLARQKKQAWRTNTPFIEKNPGDGFAGMMKGSLYDYEGAQHSVANIAMHESNAVSAAFTADLQNAGVDKYAFSGADDDNIGAAIHDVQNGGDGLKYGKLAATVGKTIADHFEKLRQDLNAAGANIAQNSDRLFRRTHDAYKISRAGGNAFGSPEAFQSWLKDGNFDHLDWSKSFDGALDGGFGGISAQTKRLQELFDQFSAGTHGNWMTELTGGAKGFGNITKKFSAQRELVWDDPKYDVAYDRNFGSGASIAESVYNSLASGGKTLGIMKEWGPNPEMNITRFKEDWKKELIEQGNRAGDIKALEDSFKSEMNNTWNVLTKPSAHPMGAVAQTFAAIRQTTNTAALGMSVFSNMLDIVNRSSQLTQNGEGGMLKNLATETAHMVTGVGLGKEAQRNLAVEMGIRSESVHLPLDPNSAANIGFRKLAQFNQQVMRFSGHGPWSNRTRLNDGAAQAYRYGSRADKSFSQLEPGQQSVLRKFGMTSDHWDVIRKADQSDLGNGEKGIVASDIAAMDPEAFRGLAGADTNASRLRARSDLVTSYRNMMGELADRATSAPSFANQAVMQMGRVEAGTFMGEMMRGALQMKGYSFNYIRNHLGRELYGYSSEKMSFPQAMATMIKGSTPGGASARAGMAKLISAGVVFGYMSNTLRDVASGKTVEDPTGDHWKDAMGRAFARQSLGLYSDFALSLVSTEGFQQNQSLYDKVGSMMGPEFGFANDVFTSLHSLEKHVLDGTSGADESDNYYKDAQRLGATLYRNTPGTTLFWTKAALDYVVLNYFSEELSPGYQQRLQDRAMKSRGQSYLAGPGPQTGPAQ
jgi:hypothetical protein